MNAIFRYRKLDPSSKMYIYWDKIICSLPLVAKMTQWNPSTIQSLSLKNCKLEKLYLACFNALVKLDVSYNGLVSLAEQGLEACHNLRQLNIAYNRINDVRTLEVLSFCSNLLDVFVGGNPFNNPEYRLALVYYTRNLKGTNHYNGLRSIDNQPVTVADRIIVYQKYLGLQQEDLVVKAWDITKILILGHKQVRSHDFCMGLKVLNCPKMDLFHVDLTKFENLEIVNFSQSSTFQTCIGLNTLEKLRVINFGGCPRLHLLSNDRRTRPFLERILNSISNLPSLTSVYLNEQQGPEVSINWNDWRIPIVTRLHGCFRLRYLDGQQIIPVTRVHGLAKSGLSAEQMNLYKFRISILTYLDDPNISFNPEIVLNQVQYRNEDVKEVHAYNLGLQPADYLAFNSFFNLKKLNLSGNQIRDPFLLKLNECKKLKELDLTRNLISIQAEEIVNFIMSIPSLWVLDMRPIDAGQNPSFGNPQMLNYVLVTLAQRQHLAKSGIPLQYLNRSIGLNERVELCRNVIKRDQLDRFRANLAFHWASKGLNEPKILNLAGYGLTDHQLDFEPFSKSLEEVYLAGNNFTTLAGMNLELCQKLRVIDIRSNKIKQMSNIYRITNQLPSLEALGIGHNPFIKKNPDLARMRFIEEIPHLRQLGCPLKEIDGKLISIDEILEAWRNSGADVAETERFRFLIMLNQSMPPGKKLKELTGLNLGRRGLKDIAVNQLVDLETLILNSNHITTQSFVGAGIQACKKLKHVNVSDNSIHNLKEIASIVDQLPDLEELIIFDNPCTERDDYVVRLIGMCERAQLGDWKLKKIDNTPIDIDIKLQALKEHSNCSTLVIDRLRFQLICRESHYDENSEVLDLVDNDLTTIEGIHAFKNCRTLLLSQNKLTNLPRKEIEQLTKLEFVDLSYNVLTSIHETCKCFQRCNNLKSISFNLSSADPSDSDTIQKYLNSVIDVLPGVSAIDGKENPKPLREHEYVACRFLNELCPDGAGFNSYRDIDLSIGSIETKQFVACLCALSHLPVKYLKVPESWRTIESYRFMLLYMCPHLIDLDNRMVTDDEKANAITICDRLRTKDGLFFLQRPISYFDELIYEGEDIDLEIESETFDKYLDDEYAKILTNTQYRDVGSMLTKFEIITTFFQVFDLIVAMAGFIEWPGVFSSMKKVAGYVALDMTSFISQIPFANFMKYIVMVAIPILILFIYRMEGDLKNLLKRYTINWCCYVTKMILLLIGLIGATLFVFHVIDPTVVPDLKSANLTNPNVELFCIISFVGGSVWTIYMLFQVFFKNNIRKESFWYNFHRLKKRGSLFGITMIYMPLVKMCLSVLLCATDTNGNSYIISYPSQSCGTTFATTTLFQKGIVAIGILTAIGFPFLLSRMITSGVNKIEINYNTKAKLDEIKEAKAAYKLKKSAANKTNVRNLEENFKKYWNDSVREFATATSYLYQSYRREMRYYKIFQMFERLLLLVPMVFMLSTDYFRVKVFAAGIIVAVYFLASLTRPFSDYLENTMDVIMRFLVTSVVGSTILTLDSYMSDEHANRFTLIGMILVCIVFFVCPLIALFRGRKTQNSASMNKLKEKNLQLKEEEEEELHELVHSRSLAHSETMKRLVSTIPVEQMSNTNLKSLHITGMEPNETMEEEVESARTIDEEVEHEFKVVETEETDH
eukprot:TRINITY_DN3284_c0_g1_i3.p1 TRINITY_DN3284_c0_g1~~TRINITY_DN3284_c0_g1_i3.p1  ORF type:complete len:1945 (+),score=449.30 TRINITY_DN3284_c0_g1_i3:851-5836(+)